MKLLAFLVNILTPTFGVVLEDAGMVTCNDLSGEETRTRDPVIWGRERHTDEVLFLLGVDGVASSDYGEEAAREDV